MIFFYFPIDGATNEVMKNIQTKIEFSMVMSLVIGVTGLTYN